MCRKLFAVLIVLIALLMAVLVSVLPQDRLASLFYVSRFIEVMIPVLGAGALIKYLFSCSKCGGGVCKSKANNNITTNVGGNL